VVFAIFKIANIRWILGFSLYYTEKKYVNYVKKLRFRGEGSTEELGSTELRGEGSSTEELRGTELRGEKRVP